jgi:hypothetical protein
MHVLIDLPIPDPHKDFLLAFSLQSFMTLRDTLQTVLFGENVSWQIHQIFRGIRVPQNDLAYGFNWYSGPGCIGGGIPSKIMRYSSLVKVHGDSIGTSWNLRHGCMGESLGNLATAPGLGLTILLCGITQNARPSPAR